jgi:hypothetical protein
MAFEPRRRHLRRLICVLLALAAPALAARAAPAETLSADKVKEAVAQRYGVQVLRVTPVEIDGVPAYAVVVMNPGGNFNEAFQVNTLMVDAQTGTLISQFRHRAAGYDLPDAADRSPPGDDIGSAVRRLINRER